MSKKSKLVLLYTVFCLIFFLSTYSMEERMMYASDGQEHASLYSHYFTHEQKEALLKEKVFPNKLLSRGSLQTIIARAYHTCPSKEHAMYFLYKLLKQSLHVHEKLPSEHTYAHNEAVMLAHRWWHNVHAQIKWFLKKDNYTRFNLNVMVGYLFELAFLHDIAHQKNNNHYNLDLNFSKVKPIITDALLAYDPHNDLQMKERAQYFRTQLHPLLDLYPESTALPTQLPTLRTLFKKGTILLLPIVNKTGIFGLHTSNSARTADIPGYCVGFGYEAGCITLHCKAFTGKLVDSPFHDAAHAETSLQREGCNTSLHERFFLKNIRQRMLHSLQELNQGLITMNEVIKEQIVLFFALHECIPPISFHDPRTKKRSLQNALDCYFEIHKIKYLSKILNEKELFIYLFNAIDSYFLLKTVFPCLPGHLKENGLVILNHRLYTINNKPIMARDMLNFLLLLSYHMQELGREFLKKYEPQFKGTFPFAIGKEY